MPTAIFYEWRVLMSVVLGVHAQLLDQRLFDTFQVLQTVQYISLSEYDIGERLSTQHLSSECAKLPWHTKCLSLVVTLTDDFAPHVCNHIACAL